MKILPIFAIVACVAWHAYAQDDDQRPVLSRGLLKRGPQRGKVTTTTTTPAPQEDVEYEDDAEYPAEEPQEPSTEAPPSSTEGKKLVGGGVRPFRSNTDLLETLKRRRAQAAEAKHRNHASAPEVTQTPEAAPVEPAKSSYSKKRFNNSPAKEAVNEESTAPKPNRSRFGRPSSRSVQPEQEEQNDAAPPPPPPPQSSRSSRTFRRGN